MPRLSAKARKIFSCYMLEGNIDKMKILARELSDPLDIAFAKYFIAEYYFVQNNFDKFLKIMGEIEDINKEHKDLLINYYLYIGHYMLYNNYQVNPELSKKYAALIETTFHQLEFDNEWEKNVVGGSYYILYLSRGGISREEIERNIVYTEKGIELLSKIPDDGEDIAQSIISYLGYHYFQIGKINKAEQCYLQSLQIGIKYNSNYLPFNLRMLTQFNKLKGNITKAHEYNNQALEAAKKLEQIPEIYFALKNRADCYFQEGKYEESLLSLQQSMKYRLKYEQPVGIYFGYYDLFRYYYEQFRLSKDRSLLFKAEEYLPKLIKIHENDVDNSSFEYFTRFAQALILKQGSFKEKAQAIEILNRLQEKSVGYHQYVEVSINFLDLLFENMTFSQDETLIKRIDKIIKDLGDYPLHTNVNAVFVYCSQQIIQAKYYYFLQKDVNKAIDILIEAKNQMKDYNLINLEQTIDKELTLLKPEIKLRESLQEQVNYSEFRTYLNDALDLVKQQPDN